MNGGIFQVFRRGRFKLNSLTFNIMRLFSGGEQGVWYDPSDLSTMYQDAAGTLPVYAPGEGQVDPPVGRILDKSGRGNHAYQTTTTSRPTLSARYNLLTATEQFGASIWTKNASSVAGGVQSPTGALTAYKLVENTANTVHHLTQLFTPVIAVYRFSLYIKAAERTKAALYTWASGGVSGQVAIDLSSGSVASGSGVFTDVTVIGVGAGWYRVSGLLSNTTTTPREFQVRLLDSGGNPLYTGDGVSGVYVWGADLRVENDGVGLPPYQRVVDANTYDTVGFPLYLRFDGVDDWLQTAPVNFSGTDKLFATAALRKLSDSTAGIVCELSSDTGSNNGAFYLAFPRNASVNEPMVGSKGTTTSVAINGSTAYPAPISIVLTGIGDISGDQAVRRVNGVVSVVSVTDQGSGNYGSYPLFIGRRNGSAVPFNGRLYSLLIRGAATPDTTTAKVEGYLNSKARLY